MACEKKSVAERSPVAKIGLHNLRRARFASQPQAARPRPGIGHRQDVGQGPQGYQGARGPPRPRRRQAALRGRPDAAHAARAEARVHQSVPRSSRRSCVSSTSAPAARATEVTRETLAAAGLIRADKGAVKLLANGEITQAVTVRGLKVSAGAREKIVAAGGRVEE